MLGAGVGIVAAPLVLGAVGFGAGGVVSGSIAAGVHSMIGNVAPGSLFASLQSAGAAGLGLAGRTVAGLFGGIAGAAAGVGAARGNDEREDVGGNDQREGECGERNNRREG